MWWNGAAVQTLECQHHEGGMWVQIPDWICITDELKLERNSSLVLPKFSCMSDHTNYSKFLIFNTYIVIYKFNMEARRLVRNYVLVTFV